MEPISNSERKKIIDAKERGETISNIMKWFGVCKSTIYSIYNRYIETGSYEAIPYPGRISEIFTDEVNKKIYARTLEVPDTTLLELIEYLKIDITEAGMSKHMKKLGLTLKKRLSMQLENKELTLSKNANNGQKNKRN